MNQIKINLVLGDQNHIFILNHESDVQQIAEDFCLEHELSEECFAYILESIQQQIQNNQSEEVQYETQSQNSQQNQSKSDLSVQETYEKWQQLIKNKKIIQDHQKKTSINSSRNSTKNSSKKNKSKSPISNPYIYDKLYKEARDKKQKQEEFQKIKDQQVMKNCTFKPKLSQQSTQIAQNLSVNDNLAIEEKLLMKGRFQQDKQNLIRELEFNKVHPFQPNSIKQKDLTLCDQLNLVDKLINYKDQKQNKILQKQKELHNYSFRPKITKDKYYMKAVEKEKSLIISQKNDNSQIKSQINDNQDVQQYKEIVQNFFQKMDCSQKGFISNNDIDLSELDNEWLKIFQNALELIDNQQLTVDFKQFWNILINDKESMNLLQQAQSYKQTKINTIKNKGLGITPRYQKLLQNQ